MEELNEHLYFLRNAPADASQHMILRARGLAERLLWLVPLGLIIGWLSGSRSFSTHLIFREERWIVEPLSREVQPLYRRLFALLIRAGWIRE